MQLNETSQRLACKRKSVMGLLARLVFGFTLLNVMPAVAQAPATQAPTTQAPTAQAPTTQAPSTQSPLAQAPVAGPTEPRVKPVNDENGLYRQAWFDLSFLDLKEDFSQATREGKRFAVIFEQQGCPYCKKLHTEVLAERYINDYVRENFRIVQIDLWGAREVTDFDGSVMSERQLAERWGILFTPTIVFFKDDLKGLEGKWGRELEATERLPLSFGAPTFYDLFVWVREKIYTRDRNFQRFHIARYAEREALSKAGAKKD